jgi:hypothetical protein
LLSPASSRQSLPPFIGGRLVTIEQPVASISDVPQLHIMSGHVAYNASSELNSLAALLTGIAAVLSAIGSVLGVL